MDKNVQREIHLSYQDKATMQWYSWYLKPDSLGRAESEAKLLIEFKNAVEVKAVEVIKGNGWEHKQERAVLSLRPNGQNIDVARGPEMSETEMQEITRRHELEIEQEIERERKLEIDQEIEIEYEGYGYSL